MLGVAVMSIFVIMFNRLFWRPLFGLRERRLHLDEDAMHAQSRLPTPAPLLEVEDVSQRYRTGSGEAGTAVLDNVSLP